MAHTTILSCLRREISDLSDDPWLFAVVSWAMPVLSVLMWLIFSKGIATDLPIGIVDLDKSSLSRALVRHYDASPSLAVDNRYADTSQGAQALRAGTIYALVVIPAELEKQATTGESPQVSAFVNNQFLLVGKLVNSALLQAHGTFTTRVEVMHNLAASTPVADMALSSAMPIGSQTTPLFNVSKNYAQFLISAILPAIWQILMVSAAVLSMTHASRRYGLVEWLGTTPARNLTAKLIVLSTIFLFQGISLLAFMYIWLGWPMHGDWALLIAAQALTALASTGTGLLIYLIIRDPARALSSAAAYVAPGLAFMGVTFPVTDMTLPARIWRSLIPVSHYVEIQFGQVNYGAPLQSALPQLSHLGLFAIPIILAILIVCRLTPSEPNQAQEETA